MNAWLGNHARGGFNIELPDYSRHQTYWGNRVGELESCRTRRLQRDMQYRTFSRVEAATSVGYPTGLMHTLKSLS